MKSNHIRRSRIVKKSPMQIGNVFFAHKVNFQTRNFLRQLAAENFESAISLFLESEDRQGVAILEIVKNDRFLSLAAQIFLWRKDMRCAYGAYF